MEERHSRHTTQRLAALLPSRPLQTPLPWQLYLEPASLVAVGAGQLKGEKTASPCRPARPSARPLSLDVDRPIVGRGSFTTLGAGKEDPKKPFNVLRQAQSPTSRECSLLKGPGVP